MGTYFLSNFFQKVNYSCLIYRSMKTALILLYVKWQNCIGGQKLAIFMGCTQFFGTKILKQSR